MGHTPTHTHLSHDARWRAARSSVTKPNMSLRRQLGLKDCASVSSSAVFMPQRSGSVFNNNPVALSDQAVRPSRSWHDRRLSSWNFFLMQSGFPTASWQFVSPVTSHRSDFSESLAASRLTTSPSRHAKSRVWAPDWKTICSPGFCRHRRVMQILTPCSRWNYKTRGKLKDDALTEARAK